MIVKNKKSVALLLGLFLVALQVSLACTGISLTSKDIGEVIPSR
jgi:hypothetical protein